MSKEKTKKNKIIISIACIVILIATAAVLSCLNIIKNPFIKDQKSTGDPDGSSSEESMSENDNTEEKEVTEATSSFQTETVAVTNETSTVTEKPDETVVLSALESIPYEMKTIDTDLRNASGDVVCKRKIDYPVFSGDDNVSNLLNEYYSSYISSPKYFTKNDTVEEEYETCFEDLEVKVTYDKNGYISVVNDIYYYYGNGHVFLDFETHTYRISDGKEMTVMDFVRDKYGAEKECMMQADLSIEIESVESFALSETGLVVYIPDVYDPITINVPYKYCDINLAI